MSCQELIKLGNEVVLSYSLTCAAPYTDIAEVVSITGFKVTSPEVDVTTLTDAAKRTQPGTPDYGELNVTINYDNTLTALLLGWVEDRLIVGFKIAVDGNDIATFDGWLKEFDPFGSVQRDQKLEGSFTVKLTGAVTYTAGS
jgi:hypothetical protein